MVSSEDARRVRKHPKERRAEIVGEAAMIALSSGLERVTLRAVADRLGVRPGLITHYFPAAEQLVSAAFVRAVTDERQRLFLQEGTPLEHVAWLVMRYQGPEGVHLARLWLNARHLCRFNPTLADCLEAQEAIDRDWFTALVRDGVDNGSFGTSDPLGAAVRILMAIDGLGAYANNPEQFDEPAYTEFVADIAEWALEVEPGTLRAAVAELIRNGAVLPSTSISTDVSGV